MSRIDNGTEFLALAREWSPVIEDRLLHLLPKFSRGDDPDWYGAVRAAVCDGGKRVRPLLVILGWQVNNEYRDCVPKTVLDLAAAVELIHCSSLILDDLPCMDDAKLRRGNQALHLEYGEDKAILVALGLLLRGIELVTNAGLATASLERASLLSQLMMSCIGPAGLICGQWFDISTKQSDSRARGDAGLASLRNLKTMPLIKFSLLGGAITGGADNASLTTLALFAEMIGNAYQLVDDILDLTDSDYSGKDAAIDLKNDRLNPLLGDSSSLAICNIEATLSEARALAARAFPAGNARDTLCSFTDYLYGHLLSALERCT